MIYKVITPTPFLNSRHLPLLDSPFWNLRSILIIQCWWHRIGIFLFYSVISFIFPHYLSHIHITKAIYIPTKMPHKILKFFNKLPFLSAPFTPPLNFLAPTSVLVQTILFSTFSCFNYRTEMITLLYICGMSQMSSCIKRLGHCRSAIRGRILLWLELLFLLRVGLWGSINCNSTITTTNFICCNNSLGLSLISFTQLAFFKLRSTERKDYRPTRRERSQLNLELQTDTVYWASFFKILIRKRS